jgi:hypothetical protein
MALDIWGFTSFERGAGDIVWFCLFGATGALTVFVALGREGRGRYVAAQIAALGWVVIVIGTLAAIGSAGD